MRQFAIGLIVIPMIWVSCAPVAPPIRPITAEIDATDMFRGIQRAHLVIPVQPGSVTLAYPKWIPGEHAPTGPLTQLAGLALSAQGTTIPWRRDVRDPFLFHIDVPQGADAVDIRFDYLSPPAAFGDGYGKTPNVSPHFLVLPFNHLLMYPADSDIGVAQIKATVHIPSTWKFDSALRPERADAGVINLPTVSVSTLVDSPLIAGEYFRTIALTSGDGATRLSIVADHAADLGVQDDEIDQLKRLVAEAGRLFGARHYREYVWLITLGARVDRSGLEHHESTDIRGADSFFTDPSQLMRWGSVIPHEYVHSWNGKYRRPAGLVTRNYQEPMIDDLLWVYEGMTRYLGDLVLRARSGLRTPEQAREYVAWVAALMDRARPGRAWRTVGDTATALPAYTEAPLQWRSTQRYRDYYEEMVLVWLEADTIIRRNSNGARSLDDFCRTFFGGENSGPALRSYTRPVLVSALNATATNDWDGFLTSRVDAINPRAPLGAC